MTWLEAELAGAPGHDVYQDVYAAGVQAVASWRRRYHGNQALWRRVMRSERLVKEMVETAPVVAAVVDYVQALPPGVPATVVDLCCGKGYLSMLLAEMLPTERLRGCVLVDKAWPRHDVPHTTGEKHISPAHLWEYREAWPVPLVTSKLDIKKRCSRRDLGTRWLRAGAEGGPVLLLGVHLCSTLSLAAVEMFNDNPACSLLVLKPCCLPGLAHTRRNGTFTIGSHTFPASDVAAAGSFVRGGEWRGPPRHHLAPRFRRWSEHLLRGIEAEAKALEQAEVQVQGGYQNAFIFAERPRAGDGGGARTRALWDGLEERRARRE